MATSLVRDLAIDSIKLAELTVAAEAELGVGELPVEEWLEAEAKREASARFLVGSLVRHCVAALNGEGVLPTGVASLQELVEWRAQRSPDATWLILPEDPCRSAKARRRVRYGELARESARCAGLLRARGLRPGNKAGILLPNDERFCFAFFGILRAGLIPVPLPAPSIPFDLDQWRDAVRPICEECGLAALITSRRIGRIARLDTKAMIVTIEEAAGIDPSAAPIAHAAASSDLALIQHTSGSTRRPLGVELTHGNLLAMVRTLGEAIAARNDDVLVSWLPLHHDMGLVGGFLATLFWGQPWVLLSPREFVAQPKRWLWALSRFGGTISVAPNFAYHICATKLPDSALEGLDLTTWRVALDGSEVVHASTLGAFATRFAKYGFRREALLPVYGLAEAALGVCFTPLHEPYRIDQVDRDHLARAGEALAASPPGPARSIVSVGRALAGTEVRISDAAGQPRGEREVGEVAARGATIMRGYHNRAAESAQALSDGWLRTGDLGYLAEGWLYITGRKKALVKRGGTSFDAQDIEAVVGAVAGVRQGCVAAIGIDDANSGTEQLGLVVETRLRRAGPRQALQRAIVAAVRRAFGIAPDRVLIVPPGVVPKTTSGKIRRQECKRRVEAGELLQGRARLLFSRLARRLLARASPSRG